jgi:hypothetical protein
MDMFINKKIPVCQLELFEKPCFLIVNAAILPISINPKLKNLLSIWKKGHW